MTVSIVETLVKVAKFSFLFGTFGNNFNFALAQKIQSCEIVGTGYGDATSENIDEFAHLVGIACDNMCYEEASQWSQVAIDYGNVPINSRDQCADLCQDTEDCDVYVYWPDGLRKTTPSGNFCNICGNKKVERENEYFDRDSQEFQNCGVVYDFFLEVELERILPDLSCGEIVSFFQRDTSCCSGFEPISAACELYAAAPYNTGGVLEFGKYHTAVTAPVDCEETAFLPLLESTSPKLDQCSDDWCADKFGQDCCASISWGEPQVCSQGEVVPIDGCSYTCCREDVEVDDEVESLNKAIGFASDGRKCWVEGHTYGVKEDGACDEAIIITVYANNEKLESGIQQKWWNSENVTLIPLPDNAKYLPANCQDQCNKNEECGGWMNKDGVCILKSALTCTPTISLWNKVLKHPSELSKTGPLSSLVAGVRGCIDLGSPLETENKAVDLSDLWYLKEDTPRCTKPYSLGTFAGQTYYPQAEDNCYYKYLTQSEVYECTKNTWIVLNGGSNVLSLFSQVVNLFAPASPVDGALIGFEETFQYNVIDLIFKSNELPTVNGDNIYYKNLKRFCDINGKIRCGQSSLNFQERLPKWTDNHFEALKSIFQDAPFEDVEGGLTRVTLVVGQIWQNAEILLNALHENIGNGWDDSKIIYFGQAMIWYPCHFEGWCHQPSLGRNENEMLKKFRSDLTSVMEIGKTTCALDRFDCFFASHGYDTLYGTARKLIAALKDITDQYDWAHMIDLNGFTIPGENIDGHVSPVIFATIMQMIWNTMCRIDSLLPSRGSPEAISFDASCWSNCEVLVDSKQMASCSCPKSEYPGSWMCVNERQCSFTKLDPVPLELATLGPTIRNKSDSLESCHTMDMGTKDQRRLINVGRRLEDDALCSRVWCGSTLDGWILSISFFALGIFLILFQYYTERKNDSQKPNELNQPEAAMESNLPMNENEDGRNDDEENVTAMPTETVISAVKLEENELKNKVSLISRLPKEHFNSIGFARLLASIHIILGHLYQMNNSVIKKVYFFAWGYTWVPWFFVLSGFVLTHARLHSRDPSKVDAPFSHIAKRLATIYPVYAFGVLLSMANRMARGDRLPNTMVLVAQSFLLQSWVPNWTEKALQSQCWFLSNLLIYWAGFGYVYKIVRTLSFKSTSFLLLFISCLPWISILVPVLDDEIDSDWYSDHIFGTTNTSVDVWTIMLKFHPIFYIHVFLFGMLLANFRTHLKRQILNKPSLSPMTQALIKLSSYGATIGMLGLILVFSIRDIRPVSHKISARLSVLLPLQGLMLLGLSPLPLTSSQAENMKNRYRDPLAILFAYAPSWVGDLSYCQYVLQFPLYFFFPVEEIVDPSFFIFLLAASFVCVKLIHVPMSKLWRWILNEIKYGTLILLILPPAFMAAIVGIAKGAYEGKVNASPTTGGFNASNVTLAPPFVRIASEAVDLRLNWTYHTPKNDTGENVELGVISNHSLINPSILFDIDDDTGEIVWIRAARHHGVVTVMKAGQKYTKLKNDLGYNGNGRVTEFSQVFDSAILIQSEIFSGNLSAGFDDDNVEKWKLDGVQPLMSVDSSLVSHLGRGTDWKDLCEPIPSYNKDDNVLVRKIVNGPEDPKVIELPTYSSKGSPKFQWGLTFSSYPPAQKDECNWLDSNNPRMYLASQGLNVTNDKLNRFAGVELKCGDVEKPEKNWIAFTHDRHLFYIYTVEPHIVVHVRASDGACVERYQSSFADLVEMETQVDVRGSASAVRYSDNEYLALFHTFKNGIYKTFAYGFEAKPPFRVKRISKKPIPLQGDRAFASSLTIIEDKVMIGYGEHDLAARVFVMSRNYLESLFC